ncbi:MAG: FAD-dependent oxidoreductase [Stackebrandtia sp.]
MEKLKTRSTTVCIVGGGPAGAMLGLLLARAGVDVTVLEKHADFLRDFRGDTVHPGTIDVMHQLGLSERFHELPHRKLTAMGVIRGDTYNEVANFGRLKVRFPYIAMVPQWDFLDFITAEASRHPNFHLKMSTAFHDAVRGNGRVCGVRYRCGDGEGEIRAELTVAADGRHSATRAALGLRPRERGVPIDVVLFRVSRRESDPDDGGLTIRIDGGDILGLIDRGAYWQAFFEVPKGKGIRALRAAGVEAFREKVARLAPFLADRVDEVESIDSLNFLDVRADRLRRWHVPGALVIGDAAHCMSPVGGLGVNLAVQDAVAVANRLVEPLLRSQRDGTHVSRAALAAVQRRRAFPAAAIQVLQDAAIRFDPDATPGGGLGLAQKLLGRLIAFGFRPEHVRSRRILFPAGG